MQSEVGQGNGGAVLALLRSRTSDLHKQVEAAMDLNASLSSRESYRSLLEGYLGLYRPMEHAFCEGTSLCRLLQAPRVQMLERDLAALGVSAEDIQHVPDSPTVAGVLTANADAFWGALYVVEGSQLGGQYIARAVKQKLGCDVETGAAFFIGAGDRTGAEWKKFLADLEARVRDPERAAAGAVAMFHEFESWLVQAQKTETLA